MTAEVIARVQSRGQLTLPKELREATRISPGDLVRVSLTDEGYLQIAPAGIKPLEYFWEKYSIDGPVDVEAMRREAQEEEAQRFWEKMNECE